MKKNALIIGLMAILGVSCNEIDTSTLNDYQGAFILNKGNGEASTISRYDYENKQVTNHIFENKNNGASLEADASAFGVHRTNDFTNGVGYILYTTSGAIDILNMETFGLTGNIDGLTHPNAMVLANSTTAYVSCGDGVAATGNVNVVAKVDLANNVVVSTIPVGVGPAKVLTSGKFLYVANKGSNNNPGNSISVIDMSNDQVVDTIEVGMKPVDMEVDIDRNIWVYCDGDANGQNRSLYKIYRSFNEDGKIEHMAKLNLELGQKEGNAENALAMSRDRRFIFYVNGRLFYRSVYKGDDTDQESESMEADSEAIDGDFSDVAFDGIDIDVKTGELHALIANGASAGRLIAFKVSGNRYILDKEYEVGVNPVFTTYFY